MSPSVVFHHGPRQHVMTRAGGVALQRQAPGGLRDRGRAPGRAARRRSRRSGRALQRQRGLDRRDGSNEFVGATPSDFVRQPGCCSFQRRGRALQRRMAGHHHLYRAAMKREQFGQAPYPPLSGRSGDAASSKVSVSRSMCAVRVSSFRGIVASIVHLDIVMT